MLYDYANGLDDDPVHDFRDVREVKSVGNSVTFRRDLTGEADIRRGVSAICDNVAARMRKKGMKCWVVQIGVKDPNLKTITRQKTLTSPTHLSSELTACGDGIAALVLEFQRTDPDAGCLRNEPCTGRRFWGTALSFLPR